MVTNIEMLENNLREIIERRGDCIIKMNSNTLSRFDAYLKKTYGFLMNPNETRLVEMYYGQPIVVDNTLEDGATEIHRRQL